MADREIVAAVESSEAQLVELQESSFVPDEPDREWVDQWLHLAKASGEYDRTLALWTK